MVVALVLIEITGPIGLVVRWWLRRSPVAATTASAQRIGRRAARRVNRQIRAACVDLDDEYAQLVRREGRR